MDHKSKSEHPLMGILLKAWQFICPIKKSEAMKFIPMTLMMFFILFNFSTLRPLKDSLIIPNLGAEVISFVKLWCVLPSAVLFTIAYMKLSNLLDAEKLFYTVTSFFISFFAIFAFAIYPYRDILHCAPETTQLMVAQFPHFKWLLILAGKWSYALFYIFAELWGALMLNLMFWQFANRITKTSEAKRFYSMFGLIGNLGLILAGGSVKFFANMSSSAGGENNTLVVYSMCALILSGLITMALYRFMNAHVLTNPKYHTQESGAAKKKLKMSISESLKTILRSRYLGYILILVLCYGTTINLIEGPWKAKIREICPTQNGYAHDMGDFIQWTGVVTIFFMIMGTNILKRFSWLFSAFLTPLIIFTTGTAFFCFIVFEHQLAPWMETALKVSPLVVAVFFGALQNILSKATKYTMFDSTKEMAFIPLGDEMRSKGKAAVDVIGGRLAKSSGAIIQSCIFMIAPAATFGSITPILMGIFMFLCITWMFAVFGLNKQYVEKVKEE